MIYFFFGLLWLSSQKDKKKEIQKKKEGNVDNRKKYDCPQGLKSG